MAETERPSAPAPAPAPAALSADSRHRAREAALQMLYQWEVGRIPIEEVNRTFWSDGVAGSPPATGVQALASTLAAGVAVHTGQVDPLITAAADNWRLERMNVMDRLILRLAVYELQYEPATPGIVVINEALELAKTFSADESVGFINGVLDSIRKTLARE